MRGGILQIVRKAWVIRNVFTVVVEMWARETLV